MAFTIDQAKEMAASIGTPVLLCDFFFLNGSFLYLSNRDLTWNGHTYRGLLSEFDLEAVQNMSESGVDIPSSMTFHIGDANGAVYLDYETTSGRGFRGCSVKARLAMLNVATGEISSDTIVRYTGICDQATPVDETRLQVRSINRIQAGKRMLPPALIQPHCWKPRPLTASQCAQASNEDSDFNWCGITDPSKPDCNNTREGCAAAGNLPAFGGITYQPVQNGGTGREYTSGNWVQLFNAGSASLYGDPLPVMLGEGWMEAPVLVMRQDGNYTRVEIALCLDHIDTGYEATRRTRVVVNGIELPAGGYDSDSGWKSLNPGNIGWWNWLTRGYRNGLSLAEIANRNEGRADPYGSLTTIEAVLPRTQASGESKPSVNVFFRGPNVRIYSDSTTFTHAWTNNPSWLLLWAMSNSLWHYEELSIERFIGAAGDCQVNVPYASQYGYTAQHPRYQANVVLRKRILAGDLIQTIRRAANMMLQPDPATGKVGPVVRGTLASQQGFPVAGSNFNTPYTSALRDGTPTFGYVAYRFTEDNAISVRGIPRPISDSPNRVQFQFQDAENNFSATSLAISESYDVERVGSEVSQSIDANCIANYDQASRIGKMTLKETLRGNPQGDTRGTQWFEIRTSIRAIRIMIGQIVSINWTRLGLVDELFRVASTAGPSKDGVMTLTVSWHEDSWYVDGNNQRPQPGYSNPMRDRLERPSYPAAPNVVAPIAGDAMYAESELTFGLAPEFELDSNGGWVGRMAIRTKLGVNNFGIAQPPAPATQANVDASGGTLSGGTYFLGISSRDEDGNWSPLSRVVPAILEPNVTAGRVIVPMLWWDDLTDHWALFAGRTPFRLTAQLEGDGTPENLTLSNYKVRTWGAPDSELDGLIAVGKFVHHSGIVGTPATVVGENFVAIGGEWEEDALADRIVSVIGRNTGGEIPVLNLHIAGNDAMGVMYCFPNPLGTIVAGDVLIVRGKPVWSNGNKTATDTLWKNYFNGGNGMDPDEEIGKLGRIISGTGAGQTNIVVSATEDSHTFANDWLVQPDETSILIIEDPEWSPLDTPYRGIDNYDPERELVIRFPIENYKARTLLIGLRTEDGGQNPAIEALMPIREVYLAGEPGGDGNQVIEKEYA
jgi:hypothetical protein